MRRRLGAVALSACIASLGLAGVAADCRKDRDLAMRYFTLGARYGNTYSQERLAKEGRPVPRVDLRENDTTTVCVPIVGAVVCQ